MGVQGRIIGRLAIRSFHNEISTIKKKKNEAAGRRWTAGRPLFPPGWSGRPREQVIPRQGLKEELDTWASR